MQHYNINYNSEMHVETEAYGKELWITANLLSI